MVWKLDLSRAFLAGAHRAGERSQGARVKFVSLRESIDLTTPDGKLMFHVFGTVAEFKRDLILGRTMAGPGAARTCGRKGGRKPVMDDRKVASPSKLMRDRETSIAEVCEAVGVSRATLYRYLGPNGTTRKRKE